MVARRTVVVVVFVRVVQAVEVRALLVLRVGGGGGFGRGDLGAQAGGDGVQEGLTEGFGHVMDMDMVEGGDCVEGVDGRVNAQRWAVASRRRWGRSR